jgi:dephospho-CoA kinase
MMTNKFAICGKQCSGKSSIMEIIGDEFDADVFTFKFAEPIYDVLSIMNISKNRLFMQEFSDLAKKHFGGDIFQKIFEENVKVFENESPHDMIELVVCDDVRYPNELNVCKKLGFYTVYVHAEDNIRKKRAELQELVFNDQHNSEQSVPRLMADCDYIIDNNGTYRDLVLNVKEMLNSARN